MAATNGALNLLQSYESSDSDEDNNIQDQISTKRALEDDAFQENIKKVKFERLPVPEALSSMFLQDKYDAPRVDNPAEHDGRLRSFAHERGNWSTHVYIPFNPASESWSVLNHILNGLEINNTHLKLIEEPHLSLSRTVVLRHHWIDSFVEDIRKKFSTISRFKTCLSEFQVYVNDDRTRTFLGIGAVTSTQQLLSLSKLCDKALAEFNLPPFYQEASFHVSVAWCVGDHKETLENLLPEIDLKMTDLNVNMIWPLNISHCYIKTGNKTCTVPLAS